jgi:[ribosomal protein S18]-alanine N-acetyltransferase
MLVTGVSVFVARDAEKLPVGHRGMPPTGAARSCARRSPRVRGAGSGRRRAYSCAVEYHFEPLTEADARAIAGWRYDGACAAYNCPPDEAEGAVRLMLDPANRYFAARDGDGDLVGFCCFGPDARVPGGEYADASVLDVGLGLRPDLTGRGRGPAFLEAIASLASTRLGHQHLGLTVAAWNRRAIRAYEKAGFQTARTFTRSAPGGIAAGSTEWRQMTRDDRPLHLTCTRATFAPARGPRCSDVRWLGPEDYSLALEAWRVRGYSLTHEEWVVSWPADGYRFAGVVTGGRLLSVAAALSWRPPSPTSWELAAVWTHEEARDRGLATAVCSFVTAYILESDRLATCSTHRRRPAMVRVAERLGYRRTDG